MYRENVNWYSPTLQRNMDMLVFGHSGARLLVFPTSKGRHFEFVDRGMIDTVSDSINKGWLQVFCVDSVDEESWYAYHLHPALRAKRHSEYDAYLLNEVLPFTRSRNPNPFLITLGCSFGGYHAINFGLKHPEHVSRILCLSGLCDIRSFVDGYMGDDVYFNNPVDFIPNEYEPRRLEALHKQDIILAVGKDDRLRAGNEKLSSVLWSKGIGNALRLWDGWSHDWEYWDRMIKCYLSGHD